MPIDSQTLKTYICQVSRHLTETKNDLLKLMKTNNVNRLADPGNLYIPGLRGLEKKIVEKNTILIIGGKQIIYSDHLRTHR